MAEKMTLKIRQVVDIANGLKRLDGVSRGREFEPYEFAAKTIWNIAKNGTIFDREVEAFNKAQRATAAESKIYDGDQISPANAARFGAYKDKIEEMKEQVIEVAGVLPLKLSELINRPATTTAKAKTNPILPTILTQIMAIIEEDAEPA